MADITLLDIAGLEGNEAAEPRVFANSATKILDANVTGAAPGGQALFNDVKPQAGDNMSVLNRGACLYIGIACNITVLMEGQPSTTLAADAITFKGLASGSFLPVLVTKILKVSKVDGTDYGAGDVGDGTILALF